MHLPKIILYSVVGFLSRPHGFEVLQELSKSSKFKFVQIYTHSLNPKSQDPTRSQRSDFNLFEKCCHNNSIPLFSIDNKDELKIIPTCDFLIEVSWRYLLPKSITKMAKIGSFGIHRGKLPDFAGAEPIKQALLKNEEEIILSAHRLDDIIDSGDTIATLSHPVNFQKNHSLEENIQRLRDEITPLFSQLSLRTLVILEKHYMNQKTY